MHMYVRGKAEQLQRWTIEILQNRGILTLAAQMDMKDAAHKVLAHENQTVPRYLP